MATSLSVNIDDDMLYDYGGATVPSLLQHASSNTAARPPPPPGARPSQVRQAQSRCPHNHDWQTVTAACCGGLQRCHCILHNSPVKMSGVRSYQQLAAGRDLRGRLISPAFDDLL